MGQFLAEAKQVPDRIITSSAVRARATLERAVEKGGWGEISTLISDDLYEASPGAVLDVVQAEDDQWSRLLLVGHEPTWSQTIGNMIGGARVKMPTAAMARIDFDVPAWRHVDLDQGTLKWLVPPKSLA